MAAARLDSRPLMRNNHPPDNAKRRRPRLAQAVDLRDILPSELACQDS
jgi:hypothetical protein